MTMHPRSTYIRRSRKTRRLKKRLAVALMCGVAGCAALLVLGRGPQTARDPGGAQPRLAAATPALAPVAAGTAAPKAGVRRVYPYSVVPGGVVDGPEVERMIRADKVVAQHYAAFDAARARVVTVGKPRAVYVSYRKGDKVYWTATKHTLAAGETLLSDGRSEIRTRCGNRVSDTAQLPVEARGPSEQELDAATGEAEDASAQGGLQNVSFGLEQDGGGGQSWLVQTYPNDAGLARAMPTAQQRSALGLPALPGGEDIPSVLDTSPLLAATSGSAAGSTAGANTGSGTSSSAAPGAPSGSPAGGGAAGNGPAPAGPAGETAGADGTGSAVDAGDTGNGGGSGSTDNAGNGGSTGGDSGAGNAGNTTNPSPEGTGGGAPTPPLTDPQSPSIGTGPAPGDPGTLPAAPGGIPEVLLPTDPVPLPDKPDAQEPDGTEVPEPGTLWLGGVAFAAMLLSRRRGRRAGKQVAGMPAERPAIDRPAPEKAGGCAGRRPSVSA